MGDEKTRSPLACLGLLALLPVALAVWVGLAVLRAVVLRSAWAWFVTPTWGAPDPPLVTLFALVAMTEVITKRFPVARPDSDRTYDTVTSLLALAGWLGLVWATLYAAHRLYPL